MRHSGQYSPLIFTRKDTITIPHQSEDASISSFMIVSHLKSSGYIVVLYNIAFKYC